MVSSSSRWRESWTRRIASIRSAVDSAPARWRQGSVDSGGSVRVSPSSSAGAGVVPQVLELGQGGPGLQVGGLGAVLVPVVLELGRVLGHGGRGREGGGGGLRLRVGPGALAVAAVGVLVDGQDLGAPSGHQGHGLGAGGAGGPLGGAGPLELGPAGLGQLQDLGAGVQVLEGVQVVRAQLGQGGADRLEGATGQGLEVGPVVPDGDQRVGVGHGEAAAVLILHLDVGGALHLAQDLDRGLPGGEVLAAGPGLAGGDRALGGHRGLPGVQGSGSAVPAPGRPDQCSRAGATGPPGPVTRPRSCATGSTPGPPGRGRPLPGSSRPPGPCSSPPGDGRRSPGP